MTDFTHDPNQNLFSGQAQELSELIQAGGIQNGKPPDDLSAGPHTDLESAMESQGKQFNPPVPQTDSEDAIEPEKPARKPRSRKSKTPEEPVSEPVPQEPEALPEDEESDAPAVLFVSLDGGVDCLCTYPPRGRPPRGARVTVRILGVNTEKCRIWGTITHMSTTR